MFKGPCIPLIFPYVKELEDERRERAKTRTPGLADYRNELWARSVRNNYQLFEEARQQIHRIVQANYQGFDTSQSIQLLKTDDTQAAALQILATLSSTQIILLACIRTEEERVDISAKYTKFVHGEYTRSQILEKKNNLVKLIQETDLKRLKRLLAPASLKIEQAHGG